MPVQVSTVAQMVILESRNSGSHDDALCVMNTHLFFHPGANHIRNIHTAAMLNEAEAFIKSTSTSSSPPALLFCGDLK